jgi:hypothetical protein
MGENQNQNQQLAFPYDPKDGFWLNYARGWGNNLVQNPLMPLQGIGTFWSAMQNYRLNKDMFNLQRKAFNQQMALAQADEDRTKQRFEWLKQARAGSSL